MSSLQDWVGRERREVDVTSEAAVTRLAAVLDHDGSHWRPNILPPLGHWLFHLPAPKQSELGADGHAKRGEFLPPIEQPRRMWAGSRLRFEAPVEIGVAIEKKSSILEISRKRGTAGDMVFVTLLHEIAVQGRLAVSEEQDLVYLNIASPAGAKALARPEPERVRQMTADAALLFRFSALTFNGHRIHYDSVYAREVEHYPALVVHGPLQAMLLLDDAVRHRGGDYPTAFEFRARSPLYADQAFELCAAGDDAWTRDSRGNVTMTARTSW